MLDSWKLKEIFVTGVVLGTYLAIMTVSEFTGPPRTMGHCISRRYGSHVIEFKSIGSNICADDENRRITLNSCGCRGHSRSTVAGDELRSKNKILHSRFVVSEDARAQAEFKIIKSETIQRLSVSALKQAELKLKVCEDMAYAKHKQLAETLVELSKAKELLAKLGASDYTDPKGSAET
ncbi:hypothetical protein Fot_37414 [Forsythia ovata]|uniref:Uncharacterized protein n=1 Tax=Forsythia ovata TaxID=205694 RepID=A0ABD1S1A5_9LAMI